MACIACWFVIPRLANRRARLDGHSFLFMFHPPGQKGCKADTMAAAPLNLELPLAGLAIPRSDCVPPYLLCKAWIFLPRGFAVSWVDGRCFEHGNHL